MRVNRCSGCNEILGKPGDSGSPVYFYGGSGDLALAYGVFHGGSTLGDFFVYMAIDNISILGVSVVTSP